MTRLLRDLVRERAPRRLRARRARDEALEEAREKVRAFVNAPASREVIFRGNATEAINLVAYAWGLNNLGPGDSSCDRARAPLELVPWQYIAKQTGADFRMLPLDDQGELRLDRSTRRARREAQGRRHRPRLNSLGTVNPVEKLAAWAHEQGAIMVWTPRRLRRTGGRRTGAGLRLRRDLGAQDVRPEWHRCPLGGAPSCSSRWSPS